MDDDEHLPHLNYTLPAQSKNGNLSQTCRPATQPNQQISNKKKFSQTMNLASYSNKNGKFYNPSGFGLSNVRLRPLKEAESKFEVAIKNFCETCKIDEDKQLMKACSAFTRSFHNFVQYSTVVFNSQHPTDDSHILLPRSAVMITARRLIVDWTRFVKKLNEITVQNANNKESNSADSSSKTGEVVPVIFSQLIKAIDDLNTNLGIYLEYYYVGSINSPIPERQIKIIDDKLEEIRKIVLDQIYFTQSLSNPNQKKKLVSSSNVNISNNKASYLTNPMIGSTGFTVNTFAEKCSDVINRIQSLFLNEMPCQRSQAGRIIMDKINLTVSLNSFADLVRGLYNFNTYDSATRAAVIEMNDELTNTFKQLGLPFELKMIQKNPNSGGSNAPNDNAVENFNNEGGFDVDIGISSKISEKEALMYITEFNSQISNHPSEPSNQADQSFSQSLKKTQMPSKRVNDRSPRKIIKK